MRYLLFLLLPHFFLYAGESSLKIRHTECLKAKYAHTLGGTLHSRAVLKKKLLQKSETQLPHTREEALTILRKRYPSLKIAELDFIIRNCHGLYRAKSGRKTYYFDPVTLTIIKR